MMMMGEDDDIEEFIEEDVFMEASVIDWDYEFDAAQFFDFDRPETLGEAEEAERWFSIAGNYPVSPLVLKLRLGGPIQREQNTTNSSLDGNYSSDGGTGSQCSTKGREVVMDNKTQSGRRPSSKQWSSTLMKPTVSHLAKLKNAGDIFLSNHLLGRTQKTPVHMDKRSLQHGFDYLGLGAKRQKLEIGYLHKASLMKHQALLLHKKSKEDGNTTPAAAKYSKLKVTVPKEPALETLQRAQNRRSRTNSEASELLEVETEILRTSSLNRKILKPPSPTATVKSKQKLTVIQAFNLETTARAMQRSSASGLSRQDSDTNSKSIPADWKRSNSDDALKWEKNEKPLRKTKSNKIYPTQEDTADGVKNTSKGATMETKLQKDKGFPANPPTELFKKLSLRSEMRSAISRPKSRVSAKGPKENAPDSFQPDFWRSAGKMNQCGSMNAIPGIADHSNVNRSLGIR